jgi:LacI family repressor for deo operon, udp, cdd, tsx, nupC, and nupG
VVSVEGNLRIEGGRAAFRELMNIRKPVTAIFAANDLTALGVLWEARAMGINIPDEISLVGLDDIPLAEQITPALTTIALPCYEIGSMAMNMLIDMVHLPEGVDRDGGRYHRRVGTNLIVRQTTAPPPG